jgi:hypothetical protein
MGEGMIARKPARRGTVEPVWDNPAAAPSGKPAGMIPASRATIEKGIHVTFAFEVGSVEKHRLEYNFSQLLGWLDIRVDNKPVRRSVRLFNEPVLEVFTFDVGHLERSSVRIEKRRKPLFGHCSRLYVDNRLARVYDGM